MGLCGSSLSAEDQAEQGDQQAANMNKLLLLGE
jgi:hypothetical protein